MRGARIPGTTRTRTRTPRSRCSGNLSGLIIASRARTWSFVLALAVGVVTAACSSSGSSGSNPSGSTSSAPGSTASAPTTSTPASCAATVFAGLTLPQKVGQLFALGLANNQLGTGETGAIRDAHVGTVWFTQTTRAGAGVVSTVADAVQAQATPAATGGVLFFVAANQEGGEIQALGGAGFSSIPSATTQGTLEPATLQRDAQTWGGELRAAGVNLDFAPVMDVVPAGTETQNAPIGRLHREFGSEPGPVGEHGRAFVQGMTAAGVVTTAKHFPGLGRVRGNTDDVAQVVDNVTTPDDPSLGSFRAAIRAGVPIVMVALATYTRIDPDHLAVYSPVVMQLLRNGLGFEGVIASDDMGAAVAVASIRPADRAIDFIAAGGNLIVSKTVAPTLAMASALVARARSDPAFAALVSDAVRRVLAEKDVAGLLPCSAGRE
jgi:beta-N-acetylhexosaminidase